MNAFFANFDSVIAFFTSDWTSETSFLRELIVPFTVAGLSAFMGVYLAARHSIRIERKGAARTILNRKIVAAASLSSQLSTLITLKRQQVNGMCNNYLESRKNLLRVLCIPTVRKDLVMQADFRMLTPPVHINSDLVKIIMAGPFENGMDVMQGFALSETIENLRSSLIGRNDLIDEIAKLSKSEHQSSDDHQYEKMCMYFGIDKGTGMIDARYHNYMEIIRSSLDDSLFHCYQLYRRYAKSAILGISAFGKEFGERPSFYLMDFSNAKDDITIPDEDGYTDWTETLAKRKKPFWQRRNNYDHELINRI